MIIVLVSTILYYFPIIYSSISFSTSLYLLLDTIKISYNKIQILESCE